VDIRHDQVKVGVALVDIVRSSGKPLLEVLPDCNPSAAALLQYFASVDAVAAFLETRAMYMVGLLEDVALPMTSGDLRQFLEHALVVIKTCIPESATVDMDAEDVAGFVAAWCKLILMTKKLSQPFQAKSDADWETWCSIASKRIMSRTMALLIGEAKRLCELDSIKQTPVREALAEKVSHPGSDSDGKNSEFAKLTKRAAVDLLLPALVAEAKAQEISVSRDWGQAVDTFICDASGGTVGTVQKGRPTGTDVATTRESIAEVLNNGGLRADLFLKVKVPTLSTDMCTFKVPSYGDLNMEWKVFVYAQILSLAITNAALESSETTGAN